MNKVINSRLTLTQLRDLKRKFSSTKKNDPSCKSKKCIMRPECKVALITGGAEGIGFSIANHLLKAGAKAVAITGLNACRGKDAVTCLNSAYGKNKAMFINSNSNCLVQLEETFKVVKETYANIDIVVNSAGICDGPHWEMEIVTNIIGTIRSTLLAYKYLGLQGSGKGGLVLNISGIGGLVPIPSAPTLSTCYHGIIGLSRSFGDPKHAVNSGVRVLTLCPGVTNTEFYRNVAHQGMTDQFSGELSTYVNTAKKQTPDVVGMASLHLLKYAESGSVWVVEGSRLFLCKIPHWEKYSVLEAQYL